MSESRWAEEFLEWWIWSVRWDGMSGMPVGAPEWPRRGGLLRQPRRLVEACKLLRAEWHYLDRGETTKDEARKRKR